MQLKLPTSEDLIPFLLNTLRDRPRRGQKNCDLYASDVAWDWLVENNLHSQSESLKEQLLIIVIEAGWELIRRGVLRPGELAFSGIIAYDPARFCLTARGREWLATADDSHYIILQSSQLRAVFEGFRFRFNDGFVQRFSEAVRCREADAYLACCVMCGAAAESVLLSLAIAKAGNPEKVISEYSSSRGRSRVISRLVGQAPKPIPDDFQKRMSLISYWRDDAAHGLDSPITAAQADFTLRELLLLAQFATQHWDRLTQTV